jgi:hypothetical protein
MRSPDEIQWAHDLLTAFVTGEVPHAIIDEASMEHLQSSLDVLCWVLDHEHVDAFPRNIARLEAILRQVGGSLNRVQ